jgi:hypothetical protein
MLLAYCQIALGRVQFQILQGSECFEVQSFLIQLSNAKCCSLSGSSGIHGEDFIYFEKLSLN